MSALNALSPSLLWQFFRQICAIPHPSKHEQRLSHWIKQWAAEQGLALSEDRVGNLVIRKPATPGMEDRKGVILQAHLDMVPQKNTDVEHDFTEDAIDAYIDGEWVTARGTTLGADNGIGMASALAVLASDDLAHGPLEVLLTIDEEAGMTGAFGLEPGLLEGEILLNTDSEQEGEVYMGCAGGVDANIRLPYQAQSVPEESEAFLIKLTGLRGGHSGCDIHLGRGNAIKLLARLLQCAERDCGLRLGDLQGGSLRNAIPREAFATVTVPAAAVPGFLALVDEQVATYRSELAHTEPFLSLVAERAAQPDRVMGDEAQRRLLMALNGCPNGVIRMSDEIQGVVETSLNLGVVQTGQDAVFGQCLIRSLIDSGRDAVEQMVESVFSLAGAQVEFAGAYPGWQPKSQSQAMQTVRETYQALYGKVPEIMVIHAGLECGLFKSAYPEWDMVSFGPTIRFPHSPDEKVHIASVERYWRLLTAVLERIPARN